MSDTSQNLLRRRMPRQQRTRQLLDVAWALAGEQGNAALSLGRLAEAAGVTKPVVYDHFATRNGLLAALYEDYDVKQTLIFEQKIGRAGECLHERAAAIAGGYIDCVVSQGNEIQGILAALAGSPELLDLRRRYRYEFVGKCAVWLAPFAPVGKLPPASLWAILGAAESLAEAVLTGALAKRGAQTELESWIIAAVQRIG